MAPEAMPPASDYPQEQWTSQQQDQDAATKRRQGFSHEKHKSETRLGDYMLGQTLGAGEFGKVKMGWKKPASSAQGAPPAPQVAIKIIKRRKLDNASRVGKVYREIAILRELDHPNIVRLHEMVETDDTIGIILEYASGGELFDYILHHRYLKDPSARRLFAQLISGVGYLHKKGIIHRDLKLENLLLDRNKNIIISDFGFAHTFDPNDMLPDTVERNLHRRDFVQQNGLDKPDKKGHRRGDLMATSCGSPCYAAPELVVSDGLYHGRKVDVWSCGVILYAMLAGYLPFDDDPKNPEGDNINALYQYIVSTDLIFPDYVTPHARDLLRRILVPSPQKRADLFEVARHSWLSEFSSVLETITSTVETPIEAIQPPVSIDGQSPPSLLRSASVREPTKPSTSDARVPSLSAKPANNSVQQQQQGASPTPRDAKRRTVQVEYVAPSSQTPRGGNRDSYTYAPGYGDRQLQQQNADREERPIPPAKDYQTQSKGKIPVATRPVRDPPRSTSDSTAFGGPYGRPSTGGSLGGSRLPPSRGSYGQPAAATVATTNAHGQVSMPKSSSGKQYVISDPLPQNDQLYGASGVGRSSGLPTAQRTSLNSANHPARGHKRSSTLGGIGDKILGRAGSITKRAPNNTRPKPDRSYPPTSMKPVPLSDSTHEAFQPRLSTESKRSGMFSRKTSMDTGLDSSGAQSNRASRRFSWLDKLRPRPSREQWDNGPRVPAANHGLKHQPDQDDLSATQSSWGNSQHGRSVEKANGSSAVRRSISRMRENLDSSKGRVSRDQLTRTPDQENTELKAHRRFGDAYNNNNNNNKSTTQGPSGSSGSSGAARRVMDYFRRRKQPSTQAVYWDDQ